MKKIMVFLFSILLASIASSHSLAIMPPTDFQIIEFVDPAGTCGQIYGFAGFVINIDLRIQGTDEDSAPNLDGFRLTIHDTNGVLIGIEENQGAVINGSDLVHARVYIHDFLGGYNTHAPTSRPWIISVEDHVYLVDDSDPLPPPPVEAYIPMASYLVDPADYNPSCASLPYVSPALDIPLNQGVSSTDVAAYNATDDNGEPALHIYDIDNEGNGTLALEITQDIIAPYINNPPSENTELMTSENGKVTLYILDTGELQINSGPDAEGKTHVLIFDGIPPTSVYGYVIDPPMFP